MGFIKNQLANVVEWEEWDENMIFYKWTNREIKKGSRLIIRPGQDAIFMFNGKIEGIFKDEGEYDIESQIIPFLSTLKGFKFGFNSGMRAEVLFVNTKDLIMNWGTKGPIMLQAPGLPGGMPIRANGTCNVRVTDYTALIDNVAGVKDKYYLEDVRARIITNLDQLLMKWISQEGKDMFNLQASAFDISKGIREDLDYQIARDGISVTGFNINNFNYPEEIQKAVNKNAAQAMVGDVGRYSQLSMVDSMAGGDVKSGQSTMGSMAEMMMGATMASQMMQNMPGFGANQQQVQQQAAPQQQPVQQQAQPQQAALAGGYKFCPECGTPSGGLKFCGNCGFKLI